MALIAPRLRWEAWFDSATPALEVSSIIEPSPGDELVAVQVSGLVSNFRNEGPELLLSNR